MKTSKRELMALIATTIDYCRQMGILRGISFGDLDDRKEPESLVESMADKGYTLNVFHNERMVCGWKSNRKPPLSFRDIEESCAKYENDNYSDLDHSPIGAEDGYMPEVGISILWFAIFGGNAPK